METVRCAQCGHQSGSRQKFCGECGRALPIDSVDAPLSAHREPSLVAPGGQPALPIDGERRPVTVLFCDIVGSTRIAESVGAERMHTMLSAFFEAIATDVHRFEGTINQFLGDGFMALFGAPVMHEDHTLRAALAAIAIRDTTDRLRDPDADVPYFQLRMGINTGLVVVGTIGDRIRTDYTAIGDTTNVAARLQHEADPGSILVSESVYHALRAHADLQSLGKRAFKGKSEPSPVYRLLRMRDVPNRTRPRDAMPVTIVGRSAEIDVIRTAIDGLEGTRGAIVAIVGDAGLGKSRLMAVARDHAERRHARWAEGHCLSFGRTLSYWPFREAIRSGLDTMDGDDDTVAFSRMRENVERLFGDTADEVVPFIGALLALPLPAHFEKQLRLLDPLAIGHQISRATLRFFEKLSLERPLVLALEDWHWADLSSAELLEHLLPLAGRAPIVFVVACRPEPQGAARSFRQAIAAGGDAAINAHELVLASLDAGDTKTLVEGLLGGSRVPAQVRDVLLSRSRGNPFYLGELIRNLIGAGGIERNAHSDEWQMTERFASIALPDTIEGVILARVDRLADGEKQVLKSASVIGRTFLYRVLQSIMTTPAASLMAQLDQLHVSELIDEEPSRPEVEFAFRHPLIQQATYDSMIESRRRELHRSVAHAIEALYEPRLEHFFSVLAYHFAKAEEWPKAQHYLFKAAEHADRLAADQEALELYEAVIATAARDPATALDPLRRAELEFRIGDAHFRAGRHDQALLRFASTLRRFGRAPPTNRVYLATAVATGLSGYMLRRFWSGPAAVSESPMSGQDQLCCQVLESSALIHFFTDPLHSVYDSLQMTALSSRHTDSRAHVLGLSLIGMTFTALGFYRSAEWSLDRARALAARHGEDWQQAMVDHFHALWNYHVGRWKTSVELADGAAERCWKTGNIRLWSAVLGNEVMYLYSLGDTRWMALAESMWRVVAETSDRQLQAWSLSGLTLMQEHRGEFVLGLATVQKAIEIYGEIPDPRLLAHAFGLRSSLLQKLGRMAEAVDYGERASGLIAKHRLSGSWTTRPLIAITELRIAQLEAASHDARSTFAEAAAKAVSAMLRQGSKVRDEGAVESQRLAGSLAWITGDPLRAQAFWNSGLAASRSLGARHAEGRLYLERGRRMRARSDLVEARALFVQVGATHEERTACGLIADLDAASP